MLQETSETAGSEPSGFRLIRQLGRGSYGVVQLCQDLQLNRHVAIKSPIPQDCQGTRGSVAMKRLAVRFDGAQHQYWQGLRFISKFILPRFR